MAKLKPTIKLKGHREVAIYCQGRLDMMDAMQDTLAHRPCPVPEIQKFLTDMLAEIKMGLLADTAQDLQGAVQSATQTIH